MKLTSIRDYLMTRPQYLIPQHGLSRWIYRLTRWQGGRMTQWAIKQFIKQYRIDMQQVEQPDITSYTSFNAFFTRALKSTARPLASATVISPVDGVVSQIGPIQDNQLIQAKGHTFSLTSLLGGHNDIAVQFQQGSFCTVYLSPRDYHRIHMPITGRLNSTIYLPGRLFSVNARTTRVVPHLFARNERVICLFDTTFGPIAVILVGALFVGSIETTWAGQITPARHHEIQRWHDPIITLQQGEELGRFNMGSTVILLLHAQYPDWLPDIKIANSLLMGQALTRDLPH